jgi:hypothetical protein
MRKNWTPLRISLLQKNQSVSKYAEGMISFQWLRCGLFMSIRITSRIWWAMLTIGDGEKPTVNGENDVHPRFRRVRVVTWIEGHNVLICGCGYFHSVGLPCIHIFHVKDEIPLTDCAIRWHKSYNYHFGRIPRYTQDIPKMYPAN